MTEMDENLSYERAAKRVKEIKEFWSHLITYVLVNILLYFVNVMTTPEYLWIKWVVLGWGIGIITHFLSVYGFFGLFGHEWEQRKIQELMDREKREKTR